MQLPADPVAGGQSRGDFPLVLGIHIPHRAAHVADGNRLRPRSGLRDSQQKIRIRLAAVYAAETVAAINGVGNAASADLVANDVEAELKGVRPVRPAQIVGELEIGLQVHIVRTLACTGDARNAEHRHVVDTRRRDALNADLVENVAAHQVRLEEVAITRIAGPEFV